MIAYLWPVVMVILSNIIYSVMAKSVPSTVNPLISVSVTYVVGAIFSVLVYFLMERGGDIVREYGKVNWVSYVLGIAVVGLEIGSICAYKAGWQVSRFFMVQAVIVAVALVAVGFLLYREQVTPTKLIGVVVCLVGLYFINK